MSHSVPISDDLYEKIAAYAANAQKQPDALIQAWLADAILRASESSSGQRPDDVLGDPLFGAAGVLAAGESGWSRRHDELLAEAYGDSHADER